MAQAERVGYPRKALILRTVDAARASGIRVSGFEVTPDGTIRILSEREAMPTSAYDRWKLAQG